MQSRRKSTDGVLLQNGSGKAKMALALLKLSTANAFAKGQLASGTSRNVDLSPPPSPFDNSVQGPPGSPFLPDDASSEDIAPPFSSQPHSPYYGMYAEYEEVMDLLHTAIIADGSCRRQLAHVTPDQVVHVAHLGIGACCSVDLVAVHGADGSRVLAAAKSCYLPASDPRLRASLREAELLRRCSDCPFIVQLVAVLRQELDPGLALTSMGSGAGGLVAGIGFDGNGCNGNGNGGGGGGLGPSMSPMSMSPPAVAASTSSYRLGMAHSSELYSRVPTPAGGAVLHHDRQQHQQHQMFGNACSGSPQAGSLLAGEPSGMMQSPGYQAWVQWRGGGSGEDLERQLMQRCAAAMAASSSRSGEAAYGSGGGAAVGLYGAGMGGLGRVSMEPLRRVSSVVIGAGTGGDCVTGGWEVNNSSLNSTLLESAGSLGAPPTYIYGGGWALSGRASGCGAANNTAGVSGTGRQHHRRSIEIIDMYGNCTGFGGGHRDGGGESSPEDAAADVGGCSGSSEPSIMCTLLLGWARCGDLRRLVQLLLSRSATHQHGKPAGAGPSVCGMPPLMPEDAARFYTGCLLLALEHLHGRMNTVHRDLKLANLLLLANGYAVVGDLGTAVDLGTVPGGRLNSRVGSPGHMAPECRDRDEAGYDISADMWSVGACLFALMTGQLPAGTAGPPNRSWTTPLSRHWSPELQDLMGRLLAWAPGQRPSVAQVMRDPWFRGFSWSALRARKMQAPGTTPWRELLWWPVEKRQLL